MTDSGQASGEVRQKFLVISLFAMFLLPIVGAMVLNVLAPSWSPFGRVNRGQLVQPPVRIEGPLVELTDRRADTDTERPGTWLIVHVGGPSCDAMCEQALVSLRQARLALGKDAWRVERWWLMTQEADARTVKRIAAAHPGLKLATLERAWPLARSPAPLQVVDPAGYVILSYERAEAASDLLKDLKRLLKISKQG